MSQQLPLSTKAKTLQDLATVITTAKILPIFSRYVHQYEKDKDRILQQTLATFSEPLIIRSSCANEDNLDASNAGAFKSVLNVPCEKEAIQKAIEQVIASYGRVSDQDELFYSADVTASNNEWRCFYSRFGYALTLLHHQL